MIRALATSALALLLAACAPLTQHPAVPPAAFAGPRIDPDVIVSFDGARLGLSTWPSETGEPSIVVIGLHGMNDYAGAFRLAGPYWAKRGITTYAYDQRGYGRSPQRGIWPGEALMDKDLRTIAALARARHPKAIIAVVGESMGSAVAITAFASDDPPDADRLVVLSPAVWGWSSQPLPQKLSAWIAGRTVGSLQVQPPRFVADRIHPTDNTEVWRKISRDPNMLWDTRADAIYGMIDLMQSAWSKTGRLRLPTAYLYGAHDEVIPAPPSFQAAAALKAGDRTAYYRDGWHLLLIDKQAETVWRDVEAFIRAPAAPLPSKAPPIPGPEAPYSSAR